MPYAAAARPGRIATPALRSAVYLQTLSEGSRICMQRHFRLGGAHRAANLRGQSIIEYVLIIAIIGLVIVFAGPGLAGAIRNQFNLVGNTVNSGGRPAAARPAEAPQGPIPRPSRRPSPRTPRTGRSTSRRPWPRTSPRRARHRRRTPRRRPPWTRIRNGRLSSRMARRSSTESSALTMTIADGSGKAGLTFLTTNEAVGNYRMNAENSAAGGWEKSELRAKMNDGEI